MCWPCLWFLSQMETEIDKGIATFNGERTNLKRNKEIKWKREDENQTGTLAERKKLSLP